MKRTITAVLTLALVLTVTTVIPTTAAAAGSKPGPYEIDGSIGFGSGSGDFDAGFGANFGAGYMLDSIDKNLQARIDLGYYNFSRDFFGIGLDFTRMPITIGARYYFPVADQLKLFAQAGVETSLDKKDTFDLFMGKHSKSEVNLGITPGAGVDFSISPEVSAFAVASIHLISDDYFSMQFGAAYHF